MLLFNRNYKITLNISTGAGISPITYIVDQHRIQFEIKKQIWGAPNTGIVKIFNLQQDLRRVLGKRVFDLQTGPFVNLQLQAGYSNPNIQATTGFSTINLGLSPNNLFNLINGSCPIIYNDREAPDFITVFQVMEQVEDFNALNFPLVPGNVISNISESFPPGSNGNFDGQTPLQIIQNICKILTGSNPIITNNAQSLLPINPIVSQSFVGSVWQSLRKFITYFGLSYYWSSDGIIIYRTSGDSINPNDSQSSLFILSQDSGLLGAPKIIQKGIEGKALLNQFIAPFKRIMVKSPILLENFNQASMEFVPINVEYKGDNRGSPWFVEFTCLFGDLVK